MKTDQGLWIVIDRDGDFVTHADVHNNMHEAADHARDMDAERPGLAPHRVVQMVPSGGMCPNLFNRSA